MGTDGDFNVGVTSTDALLEMVQNYADKGICLTVCGFGSGNLNDSMMETISNKGNGTYEFIDSENEMVKVFVHENSKFYPVANDTKVQVTVDTEMVESYRLIGYEKQIISSGNLALFRVIHDPLIFVDQCTLLEILIISQNYCRCNGYFV